MRRLAAGPALLSAGIVALLLLGAAPARAETTIGVQFLVVNGKHSEIAGSVPLSGVAPLLELRQRWRWIDLTVEGLPAVGGQGYLIVPSGYVHPLTNASIFTALTHVSIGKTGRYWLGGGITVINQITSLGSPPLAAASRVTGGRYEALALLPLGAHGEVDLRVAYMPALHGNISYQTGYFAPLAPDSEIAEATDLTAEYLLHVHSVALGLGARSINYGAHFVTPATLADRNTSFGPIIEARFRIAK
jgi:hypothetical protein